jgi:hypothetical protein
LTRTISFKTTFRKHKPLYIGRNFFLRYITSLWKRDVPYDISHGKKANSGKKRFSSERTFLLEIDPMTEIKVLPMGGKPHLQLACHNMGGITSNVEQGFVRSEFALNPGRLLLLS